MVYSVIILHPDGALRATNSAVIGRTEKGLTGSDVAVEVDLRSTIPDERTIRFIVDDKIQKTAVKGLPYNIRFGVCYLLASHHSPS